MKLSKLFGFLIRSFSKSRVLNVPNLKMVTIQYEACKPFAKGIY